MLDIDNFKELNDTLGHPKGDLVLSQVASRLRQDGEAFRIGGDEFALLLLGRDEREAVSIADGVIRRVSLLEAAPGLAVRLSAGVVTYPQLGLDRSEIVAVADQAIYLAKEHGKGRVRAYHPDLAELPPVHGPRRCAGPRGAAQGRREPRPRRRCPGRLHRSALLRRRAALRPRRRPARARRGGRRARASRREPPRPRQARDPRGDPPQARRAQRVGELVLRRHPQIGFRMLRSLGVEPVSTWVLHHHERWDGRGYPHGLGGEEIPLGSRILFVADAYDAMTSDRIYQRARRARRGDRRARALRRARSSTRRSSPCS